MPSPAGQAASPGKAPVPGRMRGQGTGKAGEGRGRNLPENMMIKDLTPIV